MQNNNLFQTLKGGLVVSCQALEDEPLHGSETMAKMAKAAKLGGARAIRANGKEDILAIKQAVSLPVIGIVKREYRDSDVFITPTLSEVNELMEADVEMIALDATKRPRPLDIQLQSLVTAIKKRNVLTMADVSTLEEGIAAAEIGFDCISTTLSGYTPYSRKSEYPDYELIQSLVERVEIPVFAEGRISTPEQAREVLELGAHAVVVGTAITRPQVITQKYVEYIKRNEP